MRLEDIEQRLVARLQASDTAGIVSAYLFGSQAEGRAHRESDVDLGILLRRDLTTGEFGVCRPSRSFGGTPEPP